MQRQNCEWRRRRLSDGAFTCSSAGEDAKKCAENREMSGVMFPKHQTVRNPKLRKKIKDDANGICEHCQQYSPYIEAAHVIARGMGGCNGPDIEENMLAICGPAAAGCGCHGAEHRGEISEQQLFDDVGRRLNKSGEECRQITRRAMGYAV